MASDLEKIRRRLRSRNGYSLNEAGVHVHNVTQMAEDLRSVLAMISPLMHVVAEARSVLLVLSVESTSNTGKEFAPCWCHADTRLRTKAMERADSHWPICQRARALSERLRV